MEPQATGGSRVNPRLLREVSRSFSLSLQLLPPVMRQPVGLAYLLARASDTLADAGAVPVAARQERLDGFVAELAGGDAGWRSDREALVRGLDHPGEVRLLESLDDCLEVLAGLPERLRRHVVEVVEVITGGQRLDLERQSAGGFPLRDDEALRDYCWRVAGCVGEFWTRVGFETLGSRFSAADPGGLERLGRCYGEGLQLVNILRDLPGDLDEGRCYLPASDPGDRRQLMALVRTWSERAREGLAAGRRYSSQLEVRRLRAGTVLPALIGEPTLDGVEAASWAQLEAGIKVSRRKVRQCLWQAWWFKG